jgi:hypothetical protein
MAERGALDPGSGFFLHTYFPSPSVWYLKSQIRSVLLSLEFKAFSHLHTFSSQVSPCLLLAMQCMLEAHQSSCCHWSLHSSGLCRGCSLPKESCSPLSGKLPMWFFPKLSLTVLLLCWNLSVFPPHLMWERPTFFLLLFWDRVFLCSPGWPWTWDPPTSAPEYWDYSNIPLFIVLTTRTKFLLFLFSPFFFFFLQYWCLNSGPTSWATPPDLFLWKVFRDKVSQNYLPRLALNHDPPDLCLQSI